LCTDAAGATTARADNFIVVKSGVSPILDRAREAFASSATLVGAARAVQEDSTRNSVEANAAAEEVMAAAEAPTADATKWMEGLDAALWPVRRARRRAATAVYKLP